MANKGIDVQGKRKKTNPKKGTEKTSNWVEVLLPILVFALTLIFFLQFSGVIELPFLDFMRLPSVKEKDAENLITKEEIIEKETTENSVVYPGPTLERVESSSSGVVESSPEVEILPETGEVSSSAETEEENDSSSQEEALFRLAKIYTAMEPEEASRIMEKFSDEEVVEILSVMKERNVAEILNAFPVERAAEIMKKMMEGR